MANHLFLESVGFAWVLGSGVKKRGPFRARAMPSPLGVAVTVAPDVGAQFALADLAASGSLDGLRELRAGLADAGRDLPQVGGSGPGLGRHRLIKPGHWLAFGAEVINQFHEGKPLWDAPILHYAEPHFYIFADRSSADIRQNSPPKQSADKNSPP